MDIDIEARSYQCSDQLGFSHVNINRSTIDQSIHSSVKVNEYISVMICLNWG